MSERRYGLEFTLAEWRRVRDALLLRREQFAPDDPEYAAIERLLEQIEVYVGHPGREVREVRRDPQS